MTELAEIPCIVKSILAWRPVDAVALNALAAAMKRVVVGKKHRLVEVGSMSPMAYFIERGMTRSYWIVDGEEITTSFSEAGSVVFSMDRVYYGAPSEECVETVEPCVVYAIDVNVMRRMIEGDVQLALWWADIHQHEYRRLHRSHKERLTLPARERYREFARQFPRVARSARLADIASYLGISRSTLSRIRKNLM